jgi:hypothetical protein
MIGNECLNPSTKYQSIAQKERRNPDLKGLHEDENEDSDWAI